MHSRGAQALLGRAVQAAQRHGGHHQDEEEEAGAIAEDAGVHTARLACLHQLLLGYKDSSIGPGPHGRPGRPEHGQPRGRGAFRMACELAGRVRTRREAPSKPTSVHHPGTPETPKPPPPPQGGGVPGSAGVCRASSPKRTGAGRGSSRASTWKHHQPRRVMGKPNRIARQAGVLPRVLKGDIAQGQNL